MLNLMSITEQVKLGKEFPSIVGNHTSGRTKTMNDKPLKGQRRLFGRGREHEMELDPLREVVDHNQDIAATRTLKRAKRINVNRMPRLRGDDRSEQALPVTVEVGCTHAWQASVAVLANILRHVILPEPLLYGWENLLHRHMRRFMEIADDRTNPITWDNVCVVSAQQATLHTEVGCLLFQAHTLPLGNGRQGFTKEDINRPT